MVVEEAKEERLKKYGINIKTIFKDGDATLERNTNHSKEDNIKSGIILEKDYFKDGKLLKKENIFDSRILYSYKFEGEEFTCKNCGMKGNTKDFTSGCPYCHTSFNIEYQRKELGSKHYYDLTIKSKKYLIVTYIIDFIISFIITLTFILDTSRTFYFFDIMKVLIGTILISLLLFYVFYYLDAMILLPFLKEWKKKENEKQEKFWQSMNYTDEDKTKFFNNINYSLRKYYFGDKERDVIDFDIIDYDQFEKNIINNQLYVDVKIEIRVVRVQNGKIISKKEDKIYRFRKVENKKELQAGINLIECPGCGSSIKASKEECEYCKTKINYYQEWYFESIIK